MTTAVEDEMPDPDKLKHIPHDEILETVEFPEELMGLNMNDRCDACSNQAAVTVIKKDGHTDLMMCYHDRNLNYDALLAQGWTVQDDILVMQAIGAYKVPVEIQETLIDA